MLVDLLDSGLFPWQANITYPAGSRVVYRDAIYRTTHATTVGESPDVVDVNLARSKWVSNQVASDTLDSVAERGAITDKVPTLPTIDSFEFPTAVSVGGFMVLEVIGSGASQRQQLRTITVDRMKEILGTGGGGDEGTEDPLPNYELFDVWHQVASSASTPPAAPSNPTLSKQGTGYLFSWTDNSTNEDRFRIERRVGTGTWDFWGQVGADSTALSALVFASADDTYTFRVRAENAAGESAWVSAVLSPASGNRAPVAPTIPQQVAIIGRPFSYTWPAFTDADGDTVSYNFPVSESWMAIDIANRTVSGTPPTGAAYSNTSYAITAEDGKGGVTTAYLPIRYEPQRILWVDYRYTRNVGGFDTIEFAQLDSYKNAEVGTYSVAFPDGSVAWFPMGNANASGLRPIVTIQKPANSLAGDTFQYGFGLTQGGVTNALFTIPLNEQTTIKIPLASTGAFVRLYTAPAL